METTSGTEPYMPNSTTEAARIRCAEPHHATARIGVLNPREQEQQSEDRLDVDRDKKEGIDVKVHR